MEHGLHPILDRAHVFGNDTVILDGFLFPKKKERGRGGVRREKKKRSAGKGYLYHTER